MSDALTQPKFGVPGQPERRSFGRRTIFRHAEAIVPGGPRFPCIVIDKSEAGALLKVKDGIELPDTFKLILEDDNQVLPCRVIRRADDQVGVEFVRSAKLDVKIEPSMLRSSLLLKKI
jgi:PilZ domain